eukprot:gnl/TRDRNA2_/TRDRNA2_93231_c0_seq1.p1 gnl/TRDRNA2_/TRDRNA2_93231_c0~~gnl/TRDRNA2_/TRDRNA2_93231_c0_seq1.p1  ORF type:complete len:222 (-),score=14.87 gnl/TRDRNA2_/TRDRNA2_93231_c0_seq1:96-668(-)
MSADVAPNGPGRDGQQLDSTILGNWVKNHTSLLLQDDTGIAMQCFSNWQMTVFGTYLGPTPLIEIPPDALTQVDNYLHNVASGDGHCGFHTESITNAALTINFGYGFQFAIEGCPALPVSSDTQCLLPNGQWGGNGAVPTSRYQTPGIAIKLVKNGYDFKGAYVPPAARNETSGAAVHPVLAAPSAVMLY